VQHDQGAVRPAAWFAAPRQVSLGDPAQGVGALALPRGRAFEIILVARFGFLSPRQMRGCHTIIRERFCGSAR
jgi:hypothetical protein